jgi:uncharacterized Ntn-hydrolase superfamily protein
VTFSIAGRCARTGSFGVAIATSSIAVGARCPHARAGVGAVSSQNVTDPALGPLLLDLMERGLSARAAIEAVVNERPHIEHRQLTAVDRNGGAFCFSGSRILGLHGESARPDCASAGNLLASPRVPDAMTSAFAAAGAASLPDRLLAALQAALKAGGEAGPVHSAALLIVTDAPYPYASLRVDWHESDPIGALTDLWRAYAPQADAYMTRAREPEAAPSYNVPGDP